MTGQTHQSGPDRDRARWASACELAGRLAESGLSRLTLISGGSRRLLDSRETDLPAALFEAAPGARLIGLDGEWVCDSGTWRQAEEAHQ